MQKTLFDKIWDSHVIRRIEQGPEVLYIDRHILHDATSPQAFLGLDNRGIRAARPGQNFATSDHNVPTHDQDKRIEDESCRIPVEKLQENCEKYDIKYFNMGDEDHGVCHVIAPEQGIILPGLTVVCGDSHTSSHGALGCVAFGVGTSEVEMVLASQCIMQPKPRKMLMKIDGKLGHSVTSKDLILYIISKVTAGGCTGYFIEYSGEAIRSLSMEARLTLCNMSIEMGARGGLIAPDQVTFDYLKGRTYAPKGEDWDKAVEYWKTLRSDDDAVFDKTLSFDAGDVEPMITYGTNPGLGMKISDSIPSGEGLSENDRITFEKALKYMDLKSGMKLLDKKIDYVFMGSCTNGRIEDFRMFTSLVKGRKKHPDVTVWLVPGSGLVLKQIREEGLDKILEEAGFQIRQPGCSACLAMNDDKISAGKYSVSTSNRNFEGRQGFGARTFLASPLTAAAAAVTGRITDPRTL